MNGENVIFNVMSPHNHYSGYSEPKCICLTKKLKLQYPTVTARLHAEIDKKITISIEMKKNFKVKILKLKIFLKLIK